MMSLIDTLCEENEFSMTGGSMEEDGEDDESMSKESAAHKLFPLGQIAVTVTLFFASVAF